MLYEKLFYWKYGDQIRFSKTKFFSILIFLYTFLSRIYYTGDFIIAFAVAIVAAIIAFIIGFVIHKSIKNDSMESYGLAEDMKHLFLYWDNSDESLLSKTKLITILVFLVSLVLFCISYGIKDFPAGIGVSMFIAAPAFLVGYFIHINKDDSDKTPEKAVKSEQVRNNEESPSPEKVNIPEFNKYHNQVSSLKKEFDIKDQKARKLVEETFQPPQLTYDKFMSYLDKCKSLFNDQIDVIETIVNLASKSTEELDNEIEEKIIILKSIIDKLDLLNNELVLNIGKSKSNEENIESLFEDMEDLINSVKDY